MMKALFITHDISNYGASRSLQLLLRNYHDIEIDLVVRKRPFAREESEESIRDRFGPGVHSIWQMPLPYDYCYKYRPDFSFRHMAARIITWILWIVNKWRLYALLADSHYDFIHLNSLVLHPIIRPAYPFILHMRDIYDGSNPAALVNVSRARGVVFIDEATRQPFSAVPLAHSIVLNNPFDMLPLKSVHLHEIEWPEQTFSEKTIFSVIGTVTEKKGVEFLLHCFLKVKDPDVRLLIVGRGPESFLTRCKTLAKADRRVVFWGEEPEMTKIYAVTDYVVRGEEYQCIGRTIYEGLYAGCHVIVPADPVRVTEMFEYDIFRERIHSYSPGSESELVAHFDRLAGSKILDREFRSNVPEYVRQFDKFVKQTISFCDMRSKQNDPEIGLFQPKM